MFRLRLIEKCFTINYKKLDCRILAIVIVLDMKRLALLYIHDHRLSRRDRKWKNCDFCATRSKYNHTTKKQKRPAQIAVYRYIMCTSASSHQTGKVCANLQFVKKENWTKAYLEWYTYHSTYCYSYRNHRWSHLHISFTASVGANHHFWIVPFLYLVSSSLSLGLLSFY